ncbi:MAG: histidine-type phosphatase [Bacteroidales bacterium]|nr:histidine-type phosphatase [Bacteroidales bacterium]
MKLTRLLILASLALFAFACKPDNTPEPNPQPVTEWMPRLAGFENKYSLEQVVVLSRHNIRTPMVGNGSVLTRVTSSAYTWHHWTEKTSYLTSKGDRLEAKMGSFFRDWMLKKDFISVYDRNPEAFRFYANGKQRCQETAKSFVGAMLPGADAEVELNVEFDAMDPVFNPVITKISDGFVTKAQSEIQAKFGADLNAGIATSLKLVEDVIDIKNSPAYPDTTSFIQFPSSVGFTLNKEPAMSGGLKMACSVSDALVLQFYEEPDEEKAAFGKALGFDDWVNVSAVKEWYQNVLFTAPSVAVNVAHPLLITMLGEMQNDKRVFSFLCGHDSNLGSVLAALEAEPGELPGAIEKSTPIGSKVIVETFLGKDGVEYADIWMVYASVAQLRAESSLSYKNPPVAEQVKLRGLKANADGLYTLADVEARFTKAIAAFDSL